MCHVCRLICYLCVELKLMINTRSISNQALNSAHPSLPSSRCWPWGLFIGAGQPLQHGEVRDTNLAWVRPVRIPTCSPNDVTRSAEHWAYPSSKSLKTDANSCTKRRECLPFKITWAQISTRDARCILSLHAGATFARQSLSMFWLGFSRSDSRVKIDHLPKRTYADTRLSKYIMEPMYTSKP